MGATGHHHTPLKSEEPTIVELITATTTKTGLTIQASYDPEWYPTGVKVTDKQLAALPITPHTWHGDWNYTIANQSA